MWMVSTRPQASSWLRTCKDGETAWHLQHGASRADGIPMALLAWTAGSPEAPLMEVYTLGLGQQKIKKYLPAKRVPAAPGPLVVQGF